MTESIVHIEIDRLLESLDGELTSHSRAIDALLDVRSASNDAHLAALVDDALRSLPGKNAAETNWLRDKLRYIGVMTQLAGALRADTSTV